MSIYVKGPTFDSVCSDKSLVPPCIQRRLLLFSIGEIASATRLKTLNMLPLLKHEQRARNAPKRPINVVTIKEVFVQPTFRSSMPPSSSPVPYSCRYLARKSDRLGAINGFSCARNVIAHMR